MNCFLTIAASDSCGGAGIQQNSIIAYDWAYWALSSIIGFMSQNLKRVFALEPINLEILKLK